MRKQNTRKGTVAKVSEASATAPAHTNTTTRRPPIMLFDVREHTDDEIDAWFLSIGDPAVAEEARQVCRVTPQNTASGSHGQLANQLISKSA